MDNPEKLATLDTHYIRRRQTKQKTQHNICWTPSYTRHGMTAKQKIQHNMCWTPSYTKHGMKKYKAKNTTQYMLDTIIHKTRDEDKQGKK
jgi:hypothetical protein